jgi:hypothetical protein
MIGIIYHVVDKNTNNVIKVGSTTKTLEKRWWTYDKKRYPNHFLREVKRIESSELDLYDKNNPLCPFLWHLVAAEHMEMVRQNTFRIGSISNHISPLQQKAIGFDAWENAKIGGYASGPLSVQNKTGINNPSFDRVTNGRKGGLSNVKSGHLQRISAAGGRASGVVQGRKNAESGRMREVQKLGLGLGGKIGGPKGMHTRWHVRRGIVSPACSLCKVA